MTNDIYRVALTAEKVAAGPVAEVTNYRDADGDLRTGILFHGDRLAAGTLLYAAPQPSQTQVALTDGTRKELEAVAKHPYGGKFAVYMSGDEARALLAGVHNDIDRDTAEKQRDAANAALEVTGENMRLAEKQRDAAYAALDAVIDYAKGWGNQPVRQELEALLLNHGVHERAPKSIRVDHYTHVNLHIDTEEWQKTRESYEAQGAGVTDLLITIDGESFEVSHGELLRMLRALKP